MKGALLSEQLAYELGLFSERAVFDVLEDREEGEEQKHKV